MIKCEDCDEPIEILTPSIANDEFGNNGTVTYEVFGNDFASIKSKSSVEVITATRPTFITTYIVTIRWRPAILPNMKIKRMRDNVVMGISSINDKGQTFGAIELICQTIL